MVALRSKSWPNRAAYAWLMGLFGAALRPAIHAPFSLVQYIYRSPRTATCQHWTAAERTILTPRQTGSAGWLRIADQMIIYDESEGAAAFTLQCTSSVRPGGIRLGPCPGTRACNSASPSRKWSPGHDSGRAGRAFRRCLHSPCGRSRRSGSPPLARTAATR